VTFAHAPITSRHLAFANLALLPLWPLAWTAPVARTGFLPFMAGEDMSILSGLGALWEADAALALLVALLALVLPYAKTLSLAAVHFGRLTPRALPALELLGKLAMADVFLVALTIVIVKGVGVGRVETAWGLWLFTFCILLSLALSMLTARRHARAQ
tara:strand:- start:278 stop:751 length:474 start_codon:yes stop_codon:yes gene_type:complete